uniref:Uncharacterized protein n=1 Tax=Oryza brachyantha TaxID=4533 RepID=J3M0B5_ORYBR
MVRQNFAHSPFRFGPAHYFHDGPRWPLTRPIDTFSSILSTDGPRRCARVEELKELGEDHGAAFWAAANKVMCNAGRDGEKDRRGGGPGTAGERALHFADVKSVVACRG